MHTARNNKPYVATYKEIIIGFIAFSIIFILLYPKEMLQDQVISENANYDLSILYLKNMLQRDPKNEKIMLALATQSIKANKKDIGYKILQLLKNSKNQYTRRKAYILSYKIAKQDYFYLKKKHTYKKMQQTYNKLWQLFGIIMKEHFYTKQNIKKFYAEAIFLKDYKNQYILLHSILKTEPKNKRYLQDAYYLTYKLKKYNDALKYLNILNEFDTEKKNKWNDEKYYLITKIYSFTQAEFYLQKEAKQSTYWEQRLINFYLYHKKYKKASRVYMQLFKQSSNFLQKRKLWIDAINTLRAGNYAKEALNLAYTHENYFLKDKKSRIYLLKLYIALGDLQQAKDLSKKILKLQR